MIKEKAKKVEAILREYPQSRDCDLDLIARYWFREIKGANTNFTDEQIKAFCLLVKSGKISLPDTITRARRKIQEEMPDTRGDKYDKRHLATGIVKQELKEIPEMIGTLNFLDQLRIQDPTIKG
tara:strand:+ start:2011 stop:2382 length:372 start_codon:yes stop_codon:yes gene_type:complete